MYCSLRNVLNNSHDPLAVNTLIAIIHYENALFQSNCNTFLKMSGQFSNAVASTGKMASFEVDILQLIKKKFLAQNLR